MSYYRPYEIGAKWYSIGEDMAYRVTRFRVNEYVGGTVRLESSAAMGTSAHSTEYTGDMGYPFYVPMGAP